MGQTSSNSVNLSGLIDIKKLSASVGAVLALIAVGYEGLAWMDSTYAGVGDVQRVELRLDQKIMNDRLKDIEQRLWVLDERYGVTMQEPTNREVRDEYRRLKAEKEETIKILDKMREHYLTKQYGVAK